MLTLMVLTVIIAIWWQVEIKKELNKLKNRKYGSKGERSDETFQTLFK